MSQGLEAEPLDRGAAAARVSAFFTDPSPEVFSGPFSHVISVA
jgi:hypothetical protein